MNCRFHISKPSRSGLAVRGGAWAFGMCLQVIGHSAPAFAGDVATK